VPTGALGIIPIGLAEDPATGRRLGDTFEIVYAPSLEALATAQRQSEAAGGRSLAAIAPASGLASTEFEVAVVASQFDRAARTVLEKGDVTRRAVLGALRERRYWHFATHGVFDWDDARESTLHLSGGETVTVGTLLDAEGLSQPRLVALSACETGLYELKETPDEFIGFPGTFMALGAAGVLGTLWPVEDRATALLMSKFYELHLNEGLAPPTALKRAQAWLSNATRADLASYARWVAKNASPERVGLGGRLETSLMRAAHEDPRFAVLATLIRPAHSTATARRSMFARLFRSKPEVAADERPFAHPYFWGGFIYTGV
jgi:CHAT domain-containing protein